MLYSRSNIDIIFYLLPVIIYFQSFFGLNFGGGAEIDIILDDADARKVRLRTFCV